MEVSSVQHLTKWHKRHEAGSSVSCFYMLLSEDAVVFFSLLYIIFAIVQPLCTSTVSEKMPDFRCCTKKYKKIMGNARDRKALQHFFFPFKSVIQRDPLQDRG